MAKKALCLIDSYPELRALTDERILTRKKLDAQLEEIQERAQKENVDWWERLEGFLQAKKILPSDWDRNKKNDNLHIDTEAGVISIDRDYKGENDKFIDALISAIKK